MYCYKNRVLDTESPSINFSKESNIDFENSSLINGLDIIGSKANDSDNYGETNNRFNL